ncbi:hypothetical protein ACIPZ8_24050 [Pseudomonas sp. NPDC089422]|uniref:hypothetical protein n=1 Tax=Pseudomonas sp. NPDC089422 TaxID=3364466 RepID=UPI0037F94A2F
MTYSPKMDADLIILGDLEIIHWATELETSSDVLTYRFDEDVNVSVDAEGAENFKKVRGIWVEHKDGSIALHQIDPSERLVPDRKTIPIRYCLIDQVIRHGHLVSISYGRLALEAHKLGFWLKVITMASQVRGYVLDHEIKLVGSQVQLMKEGTIRSLLAELSFSDQAIALGVICRLIISGSIRVEAEKNGFGYDTVWHQP